MSEVTAEVAPKPDAVPQPATPAAASQPSHKPADVRPACQAFTWRGSQSEYRMKFREVFFRLMIRDLVSITQSESDGNVSITIIYR